MGKTQTVVELLEELKKKRNDPDQEPLEILIFNCGANEHFESSVYEYSELYGFEFIPNHTIKSIDQGFRCLVEKLCEEGNSLKCLVFDDAKSWGEWFVSGCIDFVQSYIKKSTNSDEHTKWEIFVTTPEPLDTLPFTDVQNYEAKEFEPEETDSYLDTWQLKPDTKVTLHKTVGGHPFALKAIKDILKKAKVSLVNNDSGDHGLTLNVIPHFITITTHINLKAVVHSSYQLCQRIYCD